MSIVSAAKATAGCMKSIWRNESNDPTLFVGLRCDLDHVAPASRLEAFSARTSGRGERPKNSVSLIMQKQETVFLLSDVDPIS